MRSVEGMIVLKTTSSHLLLSNLGAQHEERRTIYIWKSANNGLTYDHEDDYDVYGRGSISRDNTEKKMEGSADAIRANSPS